MAILVEWSLRYFIQYQCDARDYWGFRERDLSVGELYNQSVVIYSTIMNLTDWMKLIVTSKIGFCEIL